MKNTVRVLAAGLLASLLAAPALAGPYGDDLSKCLVSSATAKDQTDLVRWIFAAAAQHPDVKGITSVTDGQRTEMTRTVGQLFERLLTDSCKAQFRDAIRYEGAETLATSFAVLGQVAMRSLMEDAAVAKSLGELENFIDSSKIEAVIKSADR